MFSVLFHIGKKINSSGLNTLLIFIMFIINLYLLIFIFFLPVLISARDTLICGFEIITPPSFTQTWVVIGRECLTWTNQFPPHPRTTKRRATFLKEGPHVL